MIFYKFVGGVESERPPAASTYERNYSAGSLTATRSMTYFEDQSRENPPWSRAVEDRRCRNFWKDFTRFPVSPPPGYVIPIVEIRREPIRELAKALETAREIISFWNIPRDEK